MIRERSHQSTSDGFSPLSKCCVIKIPSPDTQLSEEPVEHAVFYIGRQARALVQRGYVLYRGNELKLLQDTYKKLLAFKEQRQDFWIWVPALQGIRSHEIQSRFLFCWDVDADGSKGSLCLQVYFALQYLGVWRCTFYHQRDCFSINKNLWLALQVAVTAQEVLWPLVRKWVSYIHWVLLIYVFLPMDVPQPKVTVTGLIQTF